MTVYLSPQKSPEESLQAMATLCSPMTESYKQTLDAYEGKRFDLKAKACLISGVCLVVLGISLTPLAGIAAGIFVASLVVLPVGAYFLLRTERDEFQAKINRELAPIQDIFGAMQRYLREKRRIKEDVLLASIPAQEKYEDLKMLTENHSNSWNRCDLKGVTIEVMKEHAKVRAQAEAVLGRFFPDVLPRAVWEGFVLEAGRLLHGAGNISPHTYAVKQPYLKIIEDRSKQWCTMYRLTRWD